MTLRHMEIFCVVCETGSMTVAAQKLFISQPAISIAIRELEEEYAVQLFDRSSRKLCLTDFGNEIYAYIKRILSLIDDMKFSITEKKAHSTLRIGTGIVFGKLYLPDILSAFKALRRNCSIYVTVESAEVIQPMLLNGELDLCVTEGVIRSSKLQHRELSQSPLVAVCHRDHPLAGEAVVTAEMLAAESLLVRERHSPTREAIDVYFASHNLNVRPTWESISALSLLTAAGKQHGIAILPYDHYATFGMENLVVLNVQDLLGTRHIDFVYRKSLTLSPLAEEFIDFTTDFVRKLERPEVSDSNGYHAAK